MDGRKGLHVEQNPLAEGISYASWTVKAKAQELARLS
jgi:hypothetical protein